MKKFITNKITLTLILLISISLMLGACGNNSKSEPLSGFEKADMSGYEGLENYSKDLQFIELTVADVDKLMQEKATFALFMSFPNCPWCNAIIQYLNDAALQYDQKIAYVNTRKDPSWTSNIDIDNYDIFVQYFGDTLSTDSSGTPHLYTPHVFFIKDGELVYDYQGAHPEMGNDPNFELNENQKNELTDFYKEGFRKLQ